jgi:hypothetical protein
VIAEEFQRLEGLPTSDAARVERRVEVGAPLGVLVGMALPSKTRILIIEGRRSVLAAADDLEETRGLVFRLIRRQGPGERDAALEIEATDSRYNEVFAILASDIANYIREAADEREAAAALLTRLAHWRRFLERARPEGLSPEAHRGLYGELLFMRDHLTPVVGIGSAVRAWRGPSREVQDFVLDRTGIEVKTTVGRGNQNLTVTSEHQLDGRGLVDLYLYYLSMDAREGIGETLPDIVDEIRSRCVSDTDALATLNDLLVESGYLDAHRELYKELGFVFRDDRIYHVTEGFPRIIESELPDGVARVRYAISIDACEPFRLAITDALAALRGESTV